MSTVMKRNPARAVSGVPWLSGGAFSEAIASSMTWISGSSGIHTSSPSPIRHLPRGGGGDRSRLAAGPSPSADGRDDRGSDDSDGNAPDGQRFQWGAGEGQRAARMMRRSVLSDVDGHGDG